MLLNNVERGARLDKAGASKQGRGPMKRREKKKGENAVARAVALLGGPTKAARICAVSNSAVHYWIQSGSVGLLRHALRLSQASGVPIEQFVEEEDDQG